jgi:endoglucanase
MVGVYESNNSALPVAGMTLSHGFFSLADPKIAIKLKIFLSQCQQVRTVPLISLEPFIAAQPPFAAKQLRNDMDAGKYEQNLIAIGDTLAKFPEPVIIRFAHEMDVPSQYPWYFEDPSDYIHIYRLIHRLLSTKTGDKLIWMWSPQGRSISNRYWPGDDAVDLIGLSIYASAAWSPNQQLQSFASIYQQKQWLGSVFHRPIIAAEVGVSGTASQKEAWIQAAIQAYPKLDGLRGFVYFNAPQPAYVPIETGWENWQLPPAALSSLRQLVP